MPTHTPKQDEPAYIEIRQALNGDVTYVAVHDTPPYTEPILAAPGRHTIWRHDSTQSTEATEVFNVVCSTAYRDDDPAQWANGRRTHAAFDASANGERAFLRTVEAHLVLAGHIDAYATPGAEESHGIALAHGDSTWHVYQLSDSWHAAVRDPHSIYGWSVIDESIAPGTASASQLAEAISAFLADNTDTAAPTPGPATTS